MQTCFSLLYVDPSRLARLVKELSDQTDWRQSYEPELSKETNFAHFLLRYRLFSVLSDSLAHKLIHPRASSRGSAACFVYRRSGQAFLEYWIFLVGCWRFFPFLRISVCQHFSDRLEREGIERPSRERVNRVRLRAGDFLAVVPTMTCDHHGHLLCFLNSS